MISRNMVENLPHVHGSKSVMIASLIDGFGKCGDVWMGNEKFCTKRNFPGLPGLGIRESGDDWKGLDGREGKWAYVTIFG